jgi:hypothetical protein
VDLIRFAVELAKLGVEVGAQHVTPGLLAALSGVGPHAPPVFGDDGQVDVEVVDDVTTGADIGIRVPLGCHRPLLGLPT